jgi:glycosyltransferase involved in cell wall biosynthesis
VIRIYGAATRLLMAIGFRFSRALRGRARISWVVGVEEIASMVRQLAAVIPGSYSVSLYPHPFYAGGYDLERRGRAGLFDRLLWRPLLLGWLAGRADGFLYVGKRGFLARAGRAPEFEFLKRHGVAIVCYFTGNDIRAPLELERFEKETGVATLGARYRRVNAMMVSPEYDAAQRVTAADADRFADAVFTARVDQLGHLTRPTEPFLYLLGDDAFGDDRTPLEQRLPVLLHAPSSPVIKGTDLVRAAVAQLREEGYEFEYVELTGVAHDEVRAAVRRADIVLNQFYALMPGVFGVEALAAGCAVLMSADPEVETDLPPGSRDAWLVTRPDDVTDHLRALLDDPSLVAAYGERGRAWARTWAAASRTGAFLRDVLDEVVRGEYDGPRGWARLTDGRGSPT